MQLSKTKKLKVYAKTNGKCFYCGINLNDLNRTIDHILARDNGGREEIDNLVPCCRSCNSSKHSKYIEEYRRWFARKKQGIPQFTKEQDEWLESFGFEKHIPNKELFYGETI